MSCQLIGEGIVAFSGLPVPGPVLGLVLMFVGMVLHGGVPDGLGRVSDGLLAHLSLLFVPAGVGVMLHLATLRDEWLAVSAALVRVRDDRARGLALGVSCHGIGTARAFQVSDQAGAFAALAMGLMALASALVLPFVLRWVFSG